VNSNTTSIRASFNPFPVPAIAGAFPNFVTVYFNIPGAKPDDSLVITGSLGDLMYTGQALCFNSNGDCQANLVNSTAVPYPGGIISLRIVVIRATGSI
jgi:hypothetical protein